MDERALLLLGILRGQSQHGYQINEFIERNLFTLWCRGERRRRRWRRSCRGALDWRKFVAMS